MISVATITLVPEVLGNTPAQSVGCVFLLVLGDDGVPRTHIGCDRLFAEDVPACLQGGENNSWLDSDRQGNNDRIGGGRTQ
jgi:hypothetical protein